MTDTKKFDGELLSDEQLDNVTGGCAVPNIPGSSANVELEKIRQHYRITQFVDGQLKYPPK